MKDRKILSALKNLDVYDLNSFSKYVHSPYFNVNKAITQYFDIIESNIKKGTEDKLINEKVWAQVFPKEEYINQKFLKLNSDLVKLLEDFLAQKEFDQKLSLRANLKVDGARKRNMDKLYNSLTGEIERLSKLDMNQSIDYYLTKYLIEVTLFNLKTENEKKNEKFEITSELNIRKISDNLDYFYLAEKLRQYCTLLSWKKMYKLDIEIDNMEYILELANQEPYSEIPPIALYNKMQMTYTDDGNTSHYFELRTMIKKYIHLFPKDEQKEIYATAISYCINRVNKGVFEFQKETFLLYKETIENETIISKNKITATTFRNIVFFALRVEEFDWAENFIQEYAQFVDERHRENAFQFSYARLEFYRKDFNKVLDHLNLVSYDDVWYNLGSKVILIFTYYELDEMDALESLLQAFKMYIRREKSLSKDRKEHHLNLIKFMSALMKLNRKDTEKLIKLRQEIEMTKGVVSKPLLLEKIEYLLNK